MRLLVAFWLAAFVQTAFAAVTIPLQIVNGNVIVAARLNQLPLRLIVDTGGKGTLQLKAEVVSRAHLVLKPDLVSRIDAVGGHYAGNGFDVAELTLGGVIFRNLGGFVRGEAAGGLAGPLPADGMLGMEFLRPFVARFDYRHKVLTLYKHEEQARIDGECKGTQVPVLPHPLNFWVSEASTGEGLFRFAWDTGATYSIISSDVAQASGLSVKDALYTAGKFMLGPADLGPLDMVVAALHVPGLDALLGYNFFLKHVVCFDGPQSTVTVVE